MRPTAPIAATVAIALLAASCSSDGSNDAAPVATTVADAPAASPPTPTAPSPTAATTTTERSTTTQPAATTTTTEPTQDAGDPPGGFPIANELEADFLERFDSATVEVLGAQMHYVSAGDPANPAIVLLHGQPTSSFLWRDIIPGLAESNYVIAPDLIGMGRSERPDLDYTLRDHVEYFDGFVDAIGLDEMTLVVHDIGGLVGIVWAAQEPERVNAYAMFETGFAPVPSFDLVPDADFAALLPQLRDPEQGEILVYEDNVFVESFLQEATAVELSEDVLDVYRAPWIDPTDRLPMLQWPRQLPIEGEPADANELMTAGFEWISTTDTPVLLLHANPGLLVPDSIVEFARALIPKLETTNIGPGLHYLQEDAPEALVAALDAFFADLGI